VAGYFSNLKQGFDQIGVKSDLFLRNIHPFKYKVKSSNIFQTIFFYISKKNSNRDRKNVIKKYLFFLLLNILSFVLLLYSLFRYKIFIFGFKECFFPWFGFIDLNLLKFFKKRIIFVFFGSDARPPYIDGALASLKDFNDTKNLIGITNKQKKDIKRIEKYSDIIINHPPTSHFHEKNFVSILCIGIPMDIEQNQIKKIESFNDDIRILHCPSLPKAKGTNKIRVAIKSLIKKGYNLSFVEITGKPNSVVLNAIKHSDFVVDQLYSNNPMPRFVCEAAVFEKPAVICGYYYKEIHKILPKEKIPPSLYCHPDNIENAIERLIVDEEFRIKLGKRAHNFVKNQWNQKNVAARYIRMINEGIPTAWIYDPNNIRHLYGGAISEKKVKELVRSLIESGGKEALQLSDKPELENLFVEFAYS
jgi:hypothetical protein